MTMAATESDKVGPAPNRETYQAALSSLFTGRPEDTEADLTKLLLPTFTQRDDTTERDFQGFVAHMRQLRETLPAGSVTVTLTQFLRDGAQVAERHTASVKLPDGSVQSSETFLFGEVADDGRLAWMIETVRQGS